MRDGTVPTAVRLVTALALTSSGLHHVHLNITSHNVFEAWSLCLFTSYAGAQGKHYFIHTLINIFIIILVEASKFYRKNIYKQSKL